MKINLTELFQETKERIRTAVAYIEYKLDGKANSQFLAKYGLFIFGVGCLLSTDFFNWIVDSGLIIIGAAAITLSFEAFRNNKGQNGLDKYKKSPYEFSNKVMYSNPVSEILLDEEPKPCVLPTPEDLDIEVDKVNLNKKYEFLKDIEL